MWLRGDGALRLCSYVAMWLYCYVAKGYAPKFQNFEKLGTHISKTFKIIDSQTYKNEIFERKQNFPYFLNYLGVIKRINTGFQGPENPEIMTSEVFMKPRFHQTRMKQNDSPQLETYYSHKSLI